MLRFWRILASRSGFRSAEICSLSPLLEIGVLRSPEAGAGVAPYSGRSRPRHRAGESPGARRIRSPGEKAHFEVTGRGLEDLLRRIGDALRPLLDLEAEHDLKCWIGAHRAALASIAAR